MTFTLQVKVKVTIKETGVSRETGCDNYIKYLQVGNMDWHHWDDSGTDVITGVDDADIGRPTEWAIKLYKGAFFCQPSSTDIYIYVSYLFLLDASQNNYKTFCGFEIASSHLKDHGEWEVKVRYHDAVANKSIPVSIDFSVIIARAPQSIRLGKTCFQYKQD